MSVGFLKDKEKPIEISSLGEYIKAIKDVTSGTALYRHVIRRFINKIEIESTKKQGKAWEYYYSVFLMREAQSIYFTLVNFIDRLTPVEKGYLLGIYNRIFDAIKKYCKNSDIILKDFPGSIKQGNEFFLFDFQLPEEKRILPVRVYYRGEASRKWRTMPSVFRENSYNSRESFYFHEIQARAPKEFENLSHLDKLVTMQHYGTPYSST